ncbi:MAG: methyltransferase domain-containing protein [Burkholderiales bacterium]|nr:methyltransferase domain-containing protein [Burkholderiales bacterium]
MNASVLDPSAARARFERRAATYAGAAVVQREVGRRLLERFDVMRITPSTVLDVGCGPGTHTALLAARFPSSEVIAIDQARAMVARAAPSSDSPDLSGWRAHLGRWFGNAAERTPQATIRGLVADMTALPLPREKADVLWSNFAMQWAADLPRLLAEWNRVLRVGGVAMFTAPGPDTLRELRAALHQCGLDVPSRVHAFTDMHDLGDMLVHAGFADPVMDMEVITLEYGSANALWRDLQAMGGTNTLAARPRGLMTPRRLAAVAAALDAGRLDDGPIRISVEVVYGHAWKVAAKKTADGHGIVRIEDIRRGPHH